MNHVSGTVKDLQYTTTITISIIIVVVLASNLSLHEGSAFMGIIISFNGIKREKSMAWHGI